MKKKISKKELTAYIISGILAFLGFAMMVLHTVGVYLPVLNNDNVIMQMEADFTTWLGVNLNFMSLGIIVLFIGVVIAFIVLLVVAKKVDLDVEKAQRRAQRLGIEK